MGILHLHRGWSSWFWWWCDTTGFGRWTKGHKEGKESAQGADEKYLLRCCFCCCCCCCCRCRCRCRCRPSSSLVLSLLSLLESCSESEGLWPNVEQLPSITKLKGSIGVVVYLENEIKTSLGDSKNEMGLDISCLWAFPLQSWKPRSIIREMLFNVDERDCKEVWCPTSILENQHKFEKNGR